MNSLKVLKEMDLLAAEEQLRLVKKLRDKHEANHQQELQKLHRMLAKKTLEYYGEDGYDAFFERHHIDYATDDRYIVQVRGHEMSVSIHTPYGILKGSGSTWDYTPGDLILSDKPPDMDRKEYTAVKRRMEEIEDSERVLYPFHPLHRIGNGYFYTQICMYNAHKLVH